MIRCSGRVATRKCVICGTVDSKGWYRIEGETYCDRCGDVQIDGRSSAGLLQRYGANRPLSLIQRFRVWIGWV